MSVNLKALLMLGKESSAGKRTVIAYDYNALLEIGKNSASRQRPTYLEPEYDFISKNDPHPRWDPERWHAGTKAQHMKSRKDSMIKENGTGSQKPEMKGTDGSWRKKDKRSSLVMDEAENDAKADEGEFRLGPQRRSYKEGCKPQNTRDSEPFKKDSQTRESSQGGGGWREQRKQRDDRDGWRSRGGDDGDDKFRDFRNDDGGGGGGRRDDSRRSRFYDGNRSDRHDRYNRHDRYHRRDVVEDEPEWMNGGPTSQFDFMELGGFDDDHRDKRNEQNRQRNSDSPVLEAFDPSTFGVAADNDAGKGKSDDGLLGSALEPAGPDGLDGELTDINGLLGSLGNDILDDDDDGDADGGNSRFSKFFQTEKPVSPKKGSPPPPPMGNINRLDPSVWAQSERMMAAPIHRQIRPVAPHMPNIRGPVNHIPAALLPGAIPSGIPVARALLNPAQPMSLEELEGRGGPSPMSQHDNQPPPDIQMKLLNLSKQRNDFEAKSIQRMMLLQQTKPRLPGGLGSGPGDPFGGGGGGARGMHGRGPPGPAPPFLDSRALEMPQNPLARIRKPVEMPQQKSIQSGEKSNIYKYLIDQRKQRNLTPSEEAFIEKYLQEMEIQKLLIDQNLNIGRMSDHDRMGPGQTGFPSNLSANLERQKQMFDEKLRQQGGGMERPSNGPSGPGSNHDPPQKPNQFTVNQFTPTSVMRKMVRKMEDGSNGSERQNHRSQKITPLEYTGVTRVPKGGDVTRKLSGNGGNIGKPGQPPVGMRSLPGAPQVIFPPANMLRPGQPIANIPANHQQLMFQQLMMQQQQIAGVQQRHQQQPPPPTLPTDPFLQQRKQQSHRAAQQSGMTDKSTTDENIHIQKLLTPNRPRQYPDFG